MKPVFPRCHARPNGFTLVELMVTIAIAAILTMIAVPSFRGMIIATRIQGATSEFQSALAIARAEAIKRGGDARVTIVANTRVGNMPSGAPNWASGVTVFYDTSVTANGSNPPATDLNVIMRTSPAPADVSAAVALGGVNHIIYNGMGRTISSTGAMLGGTVAFGSAESEWRCTIISTIGRIRSVKISNAAYVANPGCPTS
jgi:type IV fimbrial biogenesis protein FimT